MKLGILGAGNIAGVMAKTIRELNANSHPEADLCHSQWRAEGIRQL